MILKLVILIISISCAACMPQLITLKDGKIGVNFGGYHAEAGLGGFLTGNGGAHGGLSASAGTPFGQRAAAGIGGQVDDKTFGGAYAGATAGNGIGANAGLSGSNQGGNLGAQSFVGDKSHSVIKTISPVDQPPAINQQDSYALNSGNFDNGAGEINVQKIKPPKKYTGNFVDTNQSPAPLINTYTVVKTPVALVQPQISNPEVLVYRKHRRPLRRRLHSRKHYLYQPIEEKRPAVVDVNKHKQLFIDARSDVEIPVQATAQIPVQYVPKVQPSYQVTKSVQGNVGVGSNFFDNIFNIPISTLRAVNHFLNQGLGQGGVAVKKNVEVSTRIDNKDEERVAQVKIEGNEKPATTQTHTSTAMIEGHINGSNFFDNIFNIPISTLQAVNQLLNGKSSAQGQGGLAVQKTVSLSQN